MALRFYWEKICSIHYLHFPFEKNIPSQVLKDFSVENLQPTPSSFLSKFSSEFYLSRIINYWGSIFPLYLTWGEFSLVCALSVFFSLFLSSFSFLCLSVFSLTDTWQIHSIEENGERIIIFLVLSFHPLTNIHLIHRDYYHFFLIDLFVITRPIADETCSP